MNETGCAIRLVHHDTKPPASGRDGRDLAQRASGGGIFSIADCPLSFERIGENKTLVTPSAYKFIENPRPFQFRLEGDASGGWIRLVGEDAEIMADQKEVRHLQQLLDAVNQEPGKPMSFYSKGRDKQDTLAGLKKLARQGQIHLEPSGRAMLCFAGGADLFDQAPRNFNPTATACKQPKAEETD